MRPVGQSLAGPRACNSSGSDSYDAGANKQKGGFLHITADAALAERSRQFAVSYFTRILGEK